MARRTQGTEVWVVCPHKTETGKFELLQVTGALNFKAGEDSQEKHDTTPLEEENGKTYLSGISDTGQSSFDLNLDPKIPAHVRLYELSKKNDNLTWIVGWAGAEKGSMKTVVPTLDRNNGNVTLPPRRSWNKFVGYVEKFPFDFDGNSIVKCSVSIQRSTPVEWIPETA